MPQDREVELITIHVLTDVSRCRTYSDRIGQLISRAFNHRVDVRLVVYESDVPTDALPNLKARLRTALSRYDVNVTDVVLVPNSDASAFVRAWLDLPRDRLADGVYGIWNNVTKDARPSSNDGSEYVIYEVFKL